MTKYKKSPLGR